jgi:hypothetical protein
MKLILNQAPIEGGSGAATPAAPATDWTTGLPEELRSTAAAKGWKSPADMGQAYIGAVKLIGNNVERPKPDWDEKKWDEFYKVAGRPETPDKYEFDFGKAKDKVDESRLGKWREIMHKTGLNAKQAKALMETYVNEEMSATEAIEASHRQEREAAELKLREKWGTKYEDHLKLAQAGIKRLGPEFEQFVTSTALGNRPELIELFHAIGSRVGEDTARPGGGGGASGTSDPASALAEIGKLSSDQQFWGALNDRFHPGHKAALDRWTELHRVAHGTAPVAAG